MTKDLIPTSLSPLLRYIRLLKLGLKSLKLIISLKDKTPFSISLLSIFFISGCMNLESTSNQLQSSNIRQNLKNCQPINDHFKKTEEAKICLQDDGNLIEFEKAKNKTNCIKQNYGLIPCKDEKGEIFYRRMSNE